MTFIAKTTGYAGRELPSAHITKTKKRLKQYDDIVYLEDGDEFELELFNPKTSPVLAIISINGNQISPNGIIVRPGERIFLDRYIDTPKKFTFGTYVIMDDNDVVHNAVKHNGDIKVEFYDTLNWYKYIPNTTTYTYIPYPYPTWPPNTTNPFSARNIYNSSVGFTCPATYHTNTTVSNYVNKSTETGRVEMGSKSHQKMITDTTSTFQSFISSTVQWKILPISNKPYIKDDIKLYCHGCGCKIKKSTYKFCPNCGQKLN